MRLDARLDGGGLWSDAQSAITTASGELVDPLHLTPDDIHITDIAHALSRLCRYNGHVGYFLSVARHSIWVSQLVAAWTNDDVLALHALLHDAAEAYLGDLIRPLKHGPTFGDSYKVVEASIEQVIAEKWGFEFPWPETITNADEDVLLEQELSGPMYRWTWKGDYHQDELDFLARYRNITTSIARSL